MSKGPEGFYDVKMLLLIMEERMESLRLYGLDKDLGLEIGFNFGKKVMLDEKI